MEIKEFPKWTSRMLRGHSRNVKALGWSCDGRRLASASIDTTLRIWNPERADNKNSSELRGHSHEVQSLSWSPNSPDLIASASTDCSVRIWDIRQGKPIQTISTQGNPAKEKDGALLNVVWSPDGNYIGAGDRQDRLRFYDTREWKLLATHDENANAKQRSRPLPGPSEVNEFLFTADSKAIIITFESSVQIYTFPELEHVAEILVNSAAPTSTLSIDPRSRFIAIGGMDGIVGLWDPTDWYCRASLSKLDAAIRATSISYDGELIAYCSGESALEIASTSTGASLHTLQSRSLMPNADKKPTINRVAWSPTKHVLAYSGDELPQLYGAVHLFGQ